MHYQSHNTNTTSITFNGISLASALKASGTLVQRALKKKKKKEKYSKSSVTEPFSQSLEG